MQVLRLPALEAKVGLKHTTIYKLIAEQAFPKPIAITPHARGWIESEVDEWLRKRAGARDTEAA